MDGHLELLQGSATAVADLAALIAAVREDVQPDANRIRSVLTMREEDLLSAVDALGKAINQIEDLESPFRPGGGRGVRLPRVPARAVAPQTKPRGRRKPAADQAGLFPLPALVS